MSKVWREIAKPRKHTDYMSSRNEGGIQIEGSQDNLLEKWVYFAGVNNFVFQFASMEQVLECKNYFSKKIHPSSRESGHDHEHYWHPWHSKLPKGINKRTNREKVLKSLDQIISNWGDK